MCLPAGGGGGGRSPRQRPRKSAGGLEGAVSPPCGGGGGRSRILDFRYSGCLKILCRVYAGMEGGGLEPPKPPSGSAPEWMFFILPLCFFAFMRNMSSILLNLLRLTCIGRSSSSLYLFIISFCDAISSSFHLLIFPISLSMLVLRMEPFLRLHHHFILLFNVVITFLYNTS